MRSGPVAAAVAALLLVLALLPAPSLAGQADQDQDQVRMDTVVTDVREETWKDVPAVDGVVGADLPRTPVLAGVYTNPYFNATRTHGGTLGHYLAVEVTVPEAPSSPLDPDAGKYLVDAEIQVSADEVVPAKVDKTAPNTFLAEFDLDGELVTGPDGQQHYVRPPLPPGVFDLVVEVWFVSTDPLHGAERVGLETFPVTNDPGRTVSSFLSLYPVEHLRKWGGLGGLPHVAMAPQVGTEDPFPVGFSFPASANRSAAISTFLATRRAPTGNVGDVTVASEEAHASRTSPSGTIATEVTPADVLGPKEGDLIVVAGYLAGDDLRVGSAMMVIPASDAAAEVMGYTEQTFGTDPLSQQVEGFEVTVMDESGGSTGADSVALHPGGTLLAAARFTRGETGGGDRYFANYAYSDIRQAGAPSSYRVYALLYRGTPQDTHEFHALSTAWRGLSVLVPSSLQVPRDRALDVPVRLTSAYTDGDATPDEVGFILDATVQVRGLPGDGTVTRRITLNESETRTVDAVFPPSPPGNYVLTVNVSANEVETGHTVTVTVPADGGNPLLVPGFAGGHALAALVLAAVAAALLARRRGPDRGKR